MADVDGIDPCRAAREQDLGEAAGRGADIEGDDAGNGKSEMVERRRQLQAAARDVAGGGSDRNGGIFTDPGGGP